MTRGQYRYDIVQLSNVIYCTSQVCSQGSLFLEADFCNASFACHCSVFTISFNQWTAGLHISFATEAVKFWRLCIFDIAFISLM